MRRIVFHRKEPQRIGAYYGNASHNGGSNEKIKQFLPMKPASKRNSHPLSRREKIGSPRHKRKKDCGLNALQIPAEPAFRTLLSRSNAHDKLPIVWSP